MDHAKTSLIFVVDIDFIPMKQSHHKLSSRMQEMEELIVLRRKLASSK